MKVSKEQLAKFKQIYSEQFCAEIDDKLAYETAINLINLMKIIYKPIKPADLKLVGLARKKLYGKKN